MIDVVPRLMTAEEFAMYFEPPMVDATGPADAVLDIWPYVDAVPAADVGALAVLDVEHVHRHPDDRFEHVLIGLDGDDRYLVVVIDRPAHRIVGHHFLDLIALYGLDDPPRI